MRRGLSWTAVAAAVILPACSGAGEEADARVERTDSAGMAIVRNLGPDRPLAWSFEPVLTIGGGLEGPEALSAVWDGGVAADAAGNLYLLDGQAHRVLVFDPSGTLLREMGRKGGGPGEMEFPTSLAVSAEGAVVVSDFRNGLLRWGPDGSPGQSLRPGEPLEGYGLGVGPFGIAAVLQSMSGGRDSMVYRLTLLPDSGERRVLAELRVGMTTDVGFPNCPVRLSGMPPIFAPDLEWAEAGERFVVATGTAYRLDLYDEQGDPVGSVRREVAPVPATPELAARELGDSMRIGFGGGTCAIAPEDVAEAQGVAPRVPAVRGLVGAPDGTWWVGRGIGRRDAWIIDVFAADGEYLGTLPEGTPWPAAFRSADEALVVERDEMDVPTVVVYRITREEGAG